MNLFERILYFLQGEMIRPNIYGWYHLLWIFLTIIAIILLLQGKKNERKLKRILLVYGIGALILELLKQIVWSFNYNPNIMLVTWDYNWYAFPFQLCTTPIIVSIICFFLKKGKVRNALLSYMAFITILGSLSTFIYPESCFVKTILVNIHTMYLHCGSLVISVYLLLSGEIKINIKNYINGYCVFLIFALIAEILNLLIYHSGILHGESFNMFYISPYFISSLPIFDIIQKNVPFLVFLISYLVAIILGSLIIYGIFKVIKSKNK